MTTLRECIDGAEDRAREALDELHQELSRSPGAVLRAWLEDGALTRYLDDMGVSMTPEDFAALVRLGYRTRTAALPVTWQYVAGDFFRLLVLTGADQLRMVRRDGSSLHAHA